ncbi:LSU ribosomal protein L7AE [Hydrogenispora ethanolica]|jgi:ribosomal protein L7Ae-like RNA K-turn-binding protein|uniref:LSU ribosomal protein L7AE n=1 Tax=Hydrogenispora ethanolica TaxID=1082276 RepID=A0A4R1QQ34_HYDET|nr:ribosomal L7Ae/L30e/S12e/Gadd45 family protein [Hydrogenispora ethanolica]TCL55858.1 LSU ribosomal protein L7AE [Hydrogenispora ethanolica]
MTKVETLLGFAAKAGRLITGTAAVETAIRKNRVKIVICAGDLSAKTLKNFQYLCDQRSIPFYTFGTVSEIGRWIGIPGRGIIGIHSPDFAKSIGSLLNDGGDEP